MTDLCRECRAVIQHADAMECPQYCSDACAQKRRARLNAAMDRTIATWGDTLRRLAESDYLPARTDSCRTNSGACDGSCEK